MTYPVRPGDTWSRIAQTVLGSQSWLFNLISSNQGISWLRPGVVLNTLGAGAPRPAPAPQYAPQPRLPLAQPSWWPWGGGYVNPWSRPTPAATPRPTYGPVPTYGPQPGPTATGYGGMPPAGALGAGAPWLPPQAYMTPQQWGGTPYRPPVPAGAPRPQQTGAVPGQMPITPFPWQGVPPDQLQPWWTHLGMGGQNWGLYTKPTATGGGGGGYGGWGGFGGGGGAKKPGVISLINQRQPGYSFAQPTTGRQVDYANGLGFIHWRI